MGLWFESINSINEIRNRKRLPNYLFILPSFTLLFFFSAFRGDFNPDYTNYTTIFQLINSYSFIDAFKVGIDIEFGFLLLNRLIGVFSSNVIYLFIITSFVILIGFYHQFNRYSASIWLSVLLFVTAGSFYASFNITRQILAAAIIFAGSKYLYERKFFKYLLVVSLAFLFHKSSLIMVPFYFILNFKVNLRNYSILTIGTIVILYLFKDILVFLQSIGVYDNYTVYAYGMWGQPITKSVLPIAFFIFCLFHVKKLNRESSIHRIWFNAVVFYAFFNILALQIEMVERLGRFFASYALLLIPFIFLKMRNKYLRVAYMTILIFLVISYNYVVLSDSPFDPHYFIWEK